MASKIDDLSVASDGTWALNDVTMTAGAKTVTLRRKSDGAVLVTRSFTVAEAASINALSGVIDGAASGVATVTTDVGFTPSLVLLANVMLGTTADAPSANGLVFGASTASAQRYAALVARFGYTYVKTQINEAAVLRTLSSTGNTVTTMLTDSTVFSTANSFKLIRNTAPNGVAGATTRTNYLALGGLTNQVVGTLDGVATGNANDYVEVTNLGWTPDAVIVWTAYTDAEITTDNWYSFGVLAADGQTVSAIHHQPYGGASPESVRYLNTDAVLWAHEAGAVVAKASGSIVSGGFRLTYGTAPSKAHKVYYIALQGGSYKTGTLSIPHTASNPSITTNFHPKAAIFFGGCAAAGSSIGSVAFQNIAFWSGNDVLRNAYITAKTQSNVNYGTASLQPYVIGNYESQQYARGYAHDASSLTLEVVANSGTAAWDLGYLVIG